MQGAGQLSSDGVQHFLPRAGEAPAPTGLSLLAPASPTVARPDDDMDLSLCMPRPFRCPGKGWQLANWNAPGLIASINSFNNGRNFRKWHKFETLMDRNDVAAACETHGNTSDIAVLRDRYRHHAIWGSFSPPDPDLPGGGGIVIAVESDFLKLFEKVEKHEVVPGRVVVLHFQGA